MQWESSTPWGGQQELSPEEERQEELERLTVEEYYLYDELQKVLARAKTLSRTRNSLILEGPDAGIAMDVRNCLDRLMKEEV
jgi:hypothetical protein